MDVKKNAKRMIMAGTVAATLTIGGSLLADKPGFAGAAYAAAAKAASTAAVEERKTENKKDDFLRFLGKSSDDEVYMALYEGKSLAEIASESGRDAQAVVDLQISELTQQLDARLANGQLSPETYQAHIAELPEIVARSVYGESRINPET